MKFSQSVPTIPHLAETDLMRPDQGPTGESADFSVLPALARTL